MCKFYYVCLVLLELLLIVSGPSKANTNVQISAGYNHTCLLRDNHINCWGDNQYGQTNVPELRAPIAIAAGGNSSCAIDGAHVKCWGNLQGNKLTPPALVNPTNIQLSDSGDVACVLENKQLKCWGAIQTDFFNKIVKLRGTQIYSQLKDVMQFSLGDGHMCSYEEKGIYCASYFSNEYHHVIGKEPMRWPVPHSFMKPKQLAVGSTQACMLDSLRIKCWNIYYPEVTKNILFDSPVAVDVKKSICALNKERIKCWGHLEIEEIFPKGTAVAVGENHVCAASETDTDCWGVNGLNQLDYLPSKNNPWMHIHNKAISIDSTEDVGQLRITFPDYRGSSVWKLSDSDLNLVRLPDGDQKASLYNLADTGCYLEKKSTDQYGEKSISIVYPVEQNSPIYCNSNILPLFKNDISKEVKIENEKGKLKIRFADANKLTPYLDEKGKLMLDDAYITENGNFLLLLSQFNNYHENRLYLKYAPEFLLIDIDNKKGYRIAVGQSLGPRSIAAYKDSFIFSFSENESLIQSAFGDLWMFNPQDFSLRAIEANQGKSCGPAGIKIIRDRLHSVTSSPMVCGGMDNIHQARFENLYEIIQTYSDYSDEAFEENEMISHLFDKSESGNNNQEMLIGDYFYKFSADEITLTPSGSRYQWPIPLRVVENNISKIHDLDGNKFGNLDGWFNNNSLNIKLNVEKGFEVKEIKLAFKFVMLDASVRDRYDRNNKRSNESWVLGYTIKNNPIEVTLDNQAELHKSGLPKFVMRKLESELVKVELDAGSGGNVDYHIVFDTANMPIKSFESNIGFKLEAIGKDNQLLILDDSHISYWNKWHHFESLSEKMSVILDDVLPRSIVDGNFKYVASIDNNLFVYSSVDQSFKPYVGKKLPENWLDEHSKNFRELNEKEVSELKSSHSIDQVFYSSYQSFNRFYIFFNEPSMQTTYHIAVHDYDLNGNFLRGSGSLNYFTDCYRFCDETDTLDHSKTQLYNLDSGYVLVTINGEYSIFDPENFRWLYTSGEMAELVDLFSTSDSAKLASEVSVAENSDLQSEFWLYSLNPIGDEKLMINTRQVENIIPKTKTPD